MTGVDIIYMLLATWNLRSEIGFLSGGEKKEEEEEEDRTH